MRTKRKVDQPTVTFELFSKKEGVKKVVLKVEKDLPIPPKTGMTPTSREFTISDLMRTMKVGDSILFPISMRDSIYPQAGRVLGKGCYAVRSSKEGARVWRTK